MSELRDKVDAALSEATAENQNRPLPLANSVWITLCILIDEIDNVKAKLNERETK